MSNSIALGRSSPESAVSDAVTEANSAAGTLFKWRFGIVLFLIIEALLAFAPLAILGPAIGWPASLRNPAAQQLAAIAAAPAALSLGYSIYLLYSLAILPVAVIVAWRVTGLNGKLSALIVALGALSALSRAIGILRWLTVMPMLATSYAAADPATRVAIELTFSAINSYGSGIGEVLGVALFGGLWLAVAMLAASGMSGRARTLPRWLIIFGGASALLQMALALPGVRYRDACSRGWRSDGICALAHCVRGPTGGCAKQYGASRFAPIINVTNRMQEVNECASTDGLPCLGN